METISLGGLHVDNPFKIGQVTRAGAEELFLQRYLQHYIGQILTGGGGKSRFLLLACHIERPPVILFAYLK